MSQTIQESRSTANIITSLQGSAYRGSGSMVKRVCIQGEGGMPTGAWSKLYLGVVTRMNFSQYKTRTCKNMSTFDISPIGT